MRNALARALFAEAQKDERICVLVADISPAGAMDDFRREFPQRFINVGVAEQAMIGLAAGLAARGFKPFCYTIATFALFRPYEFIRCDLAYQNLPVTVVGMGAGLSYPTLGGTHQAIDDVAAACAMPNLTVLTPSGPNEVAQCVRWCAERESGGPIYMRLGKAGEADVDVQRSEGKFPCSVQWIHVSPSDCLIISYGPITTEALEVARMISADMMTVAQVRPLPPQLGDIMRRYKRVVVIEEATGAPLGAALRACNHGGGSIETFALPEGFPHIIRATRGKMLLEVGLTAYAILTKMERRSHGNAELD